MYSRGLASPSSFPTRHRPLLTFPSPNPATHTTRQYATARASELAVRKAQQQSIATKAHDLLDDLPELTDSRLAGWRLKTGGASPTADGEAGTVQAGQAVVAEESTVVNAARAVDPSLPQQYDVVEYPIPSHAHGLIENDGRVRGVGVLLSNNRDRLDANLLPADKVDLCQIEPLTLDPEGQYEGQEGLVVWQKDELEPRVFAAYSDLKKVKSKQNGMADKWRRWVLDEDLTQGCGPPPGAEEEIVML
jgi:hypothetical protein